MTERDPDQQGGEQEEQQGQEFVPIEFEVETEVRKVDESDYEQR